MRGMRLFSIACALLCAGCLWAQSSEPSPAYRSTDSAAPGEPEIVFPQVILEIEDLSVEKVEAQLPPEAELLPPERTLPLVKEGDLQIGEPGLPAAQGPEGKPAGASADKGLTTDATLGAGMQNRVIGRFDMKSVGQGTRFSLLFNHETADGLSGRNEGSGFNTRDDELGGALALKLGSSAGLDLKGDFSETARGLQGLSTAFARLARLLSGSARFSATPWDWLTLGVGVEGIYDSLILEGGALGTVAGYRVSPSMDAQTRFGSWRIGVNAHYDWRADPAAAGGELHRFAPTLSFGVDLPASFQIEGTAGWFWSLAQSGTVSSLFPFSLRLSGTPFELLSFSLGAGYTVVTHDQDEVLSTLPYAMPTLLVDDRGWFADASLQLTATREISATVKVSFMSSEAMMDMYTTADTYSLYDTYSRAAFRLPLDIGLRWGITQWISLSISWKHEYLDHPTFVATDSLRTELVALDREGRLGGTLSMLMEPPIGGTLQLPELRVGGFWKVTQAVKLQLDADDLLWPLLPEGKRWDIYGSYVKPGFRLTGKVGITL